MKLSEWERCIAYADSECAKFPNIGWETYPLTNGGMGICLTLFDSKGNLFSVRCSGRAESFQEMKTSIDRGMKSLIEEM